MSGIAGWFMPRSGGATTTPSIEAMGAALSLWDHAPATTAESDAWGLTACGHKRSHRATRNGVDGAAYYGTINFLDSGLTQTANDRGITEALIAGFRQHGAGLLKRVRGHFALVVALGAEGRALIAIDRFGIVPMFYAQTGQRWLFGSNVDALHVDPTLSREVDTQAVYDYLYFHVVPAPRSAYRAIGRLPPAGYLLLDRGTSSIDTYWSPRYERERDRLRVADLKDEFRVLLREAVKQEAESDTVGAFLSGGTDSSTVTGMLGAALGTSPATYSIGFSAEGYDEMAYARIAAAHFHAQHHEHYVSPNEVVDAIPRVARSYDSPFGNSSAMAVYACAHQAQRDGIDRLLAGDGGDELFGGNARYATQWLFSLYSNLPRLIRSGIMEPVFCRLGLTARIPGVRKLRRYIEQAAVPLPARLETYNLLEHFGPDTVLESDFLKIVDRAGPLRLLTQTYEQVQAKTTLNRILGLDLRFTLADNDLPKVSRMCELAGIEVGYPMLSDDLLDFAARLPVRLKLKGTHLRYFFKEALRDFLPAEIISKPKHGFGVPFGPWLLAHRELRDYAHEQLQHLKNRGIVRAAFIETLFDRQVTAHAGYYGTMVWVLMMLEQWLQHHPTEGL